ncbi:hypothetical protein FFLO_06006 [Filobasidium floriforme]|uniref:Deacetylase sirtuin-type domain-containing protein n=1 Tax=Filobasidium floriforme TaxID=5210 RepID=A0A8K0JG81_9TREE|nr:hypothetical protein FFLO_06006 [Filobasidium floriforme]
MRISIPNIPLPSAKNPAFVNPLADISHTDAVQRVKRFLDQGRGKGLVLTGAGVSVDSGIRAYRGTEGHYTQNPNFRPIFYGELMDTGPKGDLYRIPDWARSFIGYVPVRKAVPNPTHMYIASLQRLGLAPTLITQNVDRLHHKASPYPLTETDRRTLELHGTLHYVHCPKNHHVLERDEWQKLLASLNPRWQEIVEETRGRPVKMNPDGDVDLGEVQYDQFVVPSCGECEKNGIKGSIVKPNVVFFGETITEEVKDRSHKMIDDASSVLAMGTSLATYSAFRLIKQAVDAKKPVLILSTGPTRADGLPGVDKIEMRAGPVLEDVLQLYLNGRQGPAYDHVRHLMTKGVIKEAPQSRTPPPEASSAGS